MLRQKKRLQNQSVLQKRKTPDQVFSEKYGSRPECTCFSGGFIFRLICHFVE
jgi:hypothetical protein